MKILFLSTWFPYPPDNGSKIRVYHLLRALAAQHEVTLASFAFGTANAASPGLLEHLYRDVHVVERNPFRRSRIEEMMRFASLSPIVTRPVPAMTNRVCAILRENAFDAVIASGEVMASYALLARSDAPLVLEEHNSMARWSRERYRNQEPLLGRIRCWMSWQKLRLYEAHLFRRFDLCTMVSEQDRSASMTMLPGYSGPVEFVPNGVDCEHNRPGIAEETPDTLIYNGALTYAANYDAMQYFLAQIYPRIRREVPEISLTITGSLDGVDLSGLALEESVNLSGYMDDVRPLVAGSAVCVIPVREGGGTRIKILEAMALGTPVVATLKGAEGLDVTPGQDVMIAHEPGEFAAQVIRLLGDPALRRQLAANGRRLVEQRYDWTSIGQRFMELIEDVASRHVREGAL